MVTRRTTRRTSDALRRKRVWAREQATLTGVSQTGTANDLATAFIADMGTAHLPVGITIGAVLLDFTATRATAGTNVTTSQLQLGIIVADETVVGEVERPLSDLHADWMWFQQVSFPAVAVGTTVSTFASLGGPVHVRAKRKAEEVNEHIYIVAQGYDVAPTFDISYAASVLMLLP